MAVAFEVVKSMSEAGAVVQRQERRSKQGTEEAVAMAVALVDVMVVVVST